MAKDKNVKKEEVATATSELTLDDILNNIDEINEVGNEKEVTITHTRLKADFVFLVPQLADLAKVGGKDKAMNMPELYKALSINLVTRITDEMLEALKVQSTADALAKLFTEDEILIVLASLMEGVEENAITIKKK